MFQRQLAAVEDNWVAKRPCFCPVLGEAAQLCCSTPLLDFPVPPPLELAFSSPSPSPRPPSPPSSPLYRGARPPRIASPDNELLYDPVERRYYEVPAQYVRPGEVVEVPACLPVELIHDVEEDEEEEAFPSPPPRPPSPPSSPLYRGARPPPIVSPDNELLYDPVERRYYEEPAQDAEKEEDDDIVVLAVFTPKRRKLY